MPKDSVEDEIRSCHVGIMEWWNPYDYSFPWRRQGKPEWKLLVTEILLQRTRAGAVAAIYLPFFERFSTPGHLADAAESEIENAVYSIGLR